MATTRAAASIPLHGDVPVERSCGHPRSFAAIADHQGIIEIESDEGDPLALFSAEGDDEINERTPHTIASEHAPVSPPADVDESRSNFEAGGTDVGRMNELISSLEARIQKLERDQNVEWTTAAFNTLKNTLRPVVAEVVRLAKVASGLQLAETRKVATSIHERPLTTALATAVLLLASGLALWTSWPHDVTRASTAQPVLSDPLTIVSAPVLPGESLDLSLPTLGTPTSESVIRKATIAPIGQPPVGAPPLGERARASTFSGDLSVQSSPLGASVLVDRHYVGDTPLRLTNVRAGSHTVWIQLEGHERWTAAVAVPANKLAQVRATLLPER